MKSGPDQIDLTNSTFGVMCRLCDTMITYPYSNPIPREQFIRDGWLPVTANGVEVFFCPNCRLCVRAALLASDMDSRFAAEPERLCDNLRCPMRATDPRTAHPAGTVEPKEGDKQ